MSRANTAQHIELRPTSDSVSTPDPWRQVKRALGPRQARKILRELRRRAKAGDKTAVAWLHVVGKA